MHGAGFQHGAMVMPSSHPCPPTLTSPCPPASLGLSLDEHVSERMNDNTNVQSKHLLAHDARSRSETSCDETAKSALLNSLASALHAERTAIMMVMEQRHKALLLKLGSVPESQPTRGFADQVLHNQQENVNSFDDAVDEVKRDESVWNSTAKKLHPRALRATMTPSEILRIEMEGSNGLHYVRLGLRCLVYGERFEGFIVLLICLNCLVMIAEAQAHSIGVSHELHAQGVLQNSQIMKGEVLPGTWAVLAVTELGCGLVFALEVACKLGSDPQRFVSSTWNAFDTLLVLFWALSLFAHTLGKMSGLLRLLRLGKFLRIVRLVKSIETFNVLHVLFISLKNSWAVFLWSFMLVLGITSFGALVSNTTLEHFIEDATNPPEARRRVFERFGSFSRSLCSMFEVTLGNFFPVVDVLREEVNEWYVFALMLYYSVASFSIVQVIRAVFLRETMKVASWEDDLMVLEQDEAMKKHLYDMERFFREADESGDGFLSYSEFSSLCQDNRVRSWLKAQGIDSSQAQLVFKLIDDDGDNTLSAEELVRGIAKLKGFARSMDTMIIERLCREIESDLASLRQVGGDSASHMKKARSKSVNNFGGDSPRRTKKVRAKSLKV